MDIEDTFNTIKTILYNQKEDNENNHKKIKEYEKFIFELKLEIIDFKIKRMNYSQSKNFTSSEQYAAFNKLLEDNQLFENEILNRIADL